MAKNTWAIIAASKKKIGAMSAEITALKRQLSDSEERISALEENNKDLQLELEER